MPPTGYIQVHAYTSDAQLPLENTTVTVTAGDGTAIAMRLTDRSGRITPIPIPTPPLSDSQSPDTGETPFATVTLRARLRGYEQIEAENLQIFPDTVTVQQLEMIPLAEFPDQWGAVEIFQTPPQNL